MNINKIKEIVLLNEKYEVFEGHIEKHNLFTLAKVRGREHEVKIPTGIDDHVLSITFYQEKWNRSSIVIGILSEKENIDTLISYNVYKNDEDIKELEKHPKLIALLNNAENLINENRGLRREPERKRKKLNTKILQNYT